MADEDTLNEVTPVVDTVNETPKPAPSKRKAAEKTAAMAKEIAPAEASTKRRRYSEAERAEKVAAIDAGISNGTTLKASAKSAGVTEQSYYQWKKVAKAPTTTPRSPDSTAFTDLLELEAENQRLRAQLADKLRAENEELRKRIGKS